MLNPEWREKSTALQNNTWQQQTNYAACIGNRFGPHSGQTQYQKQENITFEISSLVLDT